MNEHDPLLVWVGDVRHITRQQVILRFVSIVAALGAMVAGDQASESSAAQPLLMFVIVLAAISAALPDSHTGLLLLGVIMLYWSGAVDDPGTPWALVGGLCVLLFHTSTSAAAMIPARAKVAPLVLQRWMIRTGAVALAIVAMWSLVAAAVADDSPTSVALVVVAFVLVASFGVLLRRKTVEN